MKKLVPLTRDSITSRLVRDIDTWPLREYGTLRIPKRLGERTDPAPGIAEKYRIQIGQLPGLEKSFREMHQLAVSWVLAIGLGVSANMFATAFFGQVGIPNIQWTAFLGVLVMLFAVLYYAYFPPNFAHSIMILTAPLTPAYVPSKLNASKLNWKAQVGFPASYDEVTGQFATLFTLCTFRDAVYKTGLKKIKVGRVEGEYPVTLSLELKSRSDFFFDRGVVRESISEVRSLLEHLLQAELRLSTCDWEADEAEWVKDGKGVAFLNEIYQWPIDELTNQVRTQFSGWVPQTCDAE